MKDICIIGSGGFGREVRCLIDDINQARPQWNIIGFVNTDTDEDGGECDGLPILNFKRMLSGPALPSFALGIGHPAIKRKILKLLPTTAQLPHLIHPNVIRSPRVILDGQGSVITAGNILTTNITIKSFAMINLACTVGHDVTIGEYCVLSPGVNVSGFVKIGEGVSIGTGTKIIEGRKIGDWSIIGAGSVVIKDLPANVTAVGAPATVVKVREEGWYQ